MHKKIDQAFTVSNEAFALLWILFVLGNRNLYEKER